jgi:hypothetical protein
MKMMKIEKRLSLLTSKGTIKLKEMHMSAFFSRNRSKTRAFTKKQRIKKLYSTSNVFLSPEIYPNH